MSVLSFCIDCVNHKEIPLEAIAKFFYGQRVGIVSWIDVVEYIEVSVCGAVPQENYRRLYVHFGNETDLLERSELFKQQLMSGDKEWNLTDNAYSHGEVSITISVNKTASQTKHYCKNETSYSFDISFDILKGTFDNSKAWSIIEILGDEGVQYNNLYTNNYNIFQYIEDSSFQDIKIVSKTLEEGEITVDKHEERRVDMWNPIYDFHNKYTTEYGAIGFTKDEYKQYYGETWKHYWDDSIVWKQYYPNLHSFMKLNISVTIGPFFPPHSCAMKDLIYPIEQKIIKIEEIYYSKSENSQKIFSPICQIETNRASYFIADMNIDFKNLDRNDFYTIKNYLLNIEHMCEILRPVDIYNSMPESRIYINFE